MSVAICARAPRTDATRLQGADAMHAWVLVWCGSEESEGRGWIGLDPTNAMLASDEHVVLATGRDYTDVAPMDGVDFRLGRAAHRRCRQRTAGGELGDVLINRDVCSAPESRHKSLHRGTSAQGPGAAMNEAEAEMPAGIAAGGRISWRRT